MNNYVVATIKDWNIKQYKQRISDYPGNWTLITDKSNLTVEILRQLAPKYVFFPHWSWFVPSEILNEFNCVCFHMTDVPYGRGGSPLQNLIIRGHESTKLTALKMMDELDAGPVYLKCNMSLSGSAADVFNRSSSTTFDMIEDIVRNELSPKPQVGEVVKFTRRTPKQSELLSELNLKTFYNTVRMLDAESYPRAYIKLGGLKLEFSDILNSGNELKASVRIFEEEDKNDE